MTVLLGCSLSVTELPPMGESNRLLILEMLFLHESDFAVMLVKIHYIVKPVCRYKDTIGLGALQTKNACELLQSQKSLSA